MAFPKYHNFEYYRGDTFEFDIELKNQDGTDFPISAYENVSFTISPQRGSAGAKTVATASKVEPGTINCKILPATGRTLAAGVYFYDVQLTDTTPEPDVIYTVLTGMIEVTDDITGS